MPMLAKSKVVGGKYRIVLPGDRTFKKKAAWPIHRCGEKCSLPKTPCKAISLIRLVSTNRENFSSQPMISRVMYLMGPFIDNY